MRLASNSSDPEIQKAGVQGLGKGLNNVDWKNGETHEHIVRDIAAIACGSEDVRVKQGAMTILGQYAEKPHDTYPTKVYKDNYGEFYGRKINASAQKAATQLVGTIAASFTQKT